MPLGSEVGDQGPFDEALENVIEVFDGAEIVDGDR